MPTATIKEVTEYLLEVLEAWDEWPVHPVETRLTLDTADREGLFLTVIEDEARYRVDSPQPGTHALGVMAKFVVLGAVRVRQSDYDVKLVAEWCAALRADLHAAAVAMTPLGRGIGYLMLRKFTVGDVSEDDLIAVTLEFDAGGYSA